MGAGGSALDLQEIADPLQTARSSEYDQAKRFYISDAGDLVQAC